ncbi:cytochrome C552 [Cupriavidus sp. UYMSc13B]|nr:cytochrome C552 [Cupriavidus sp. UYMSc13B]
MLLALALLGTGSASAAPQDIKLPAENVKLKPAKLPGYGVAMQKCAICHSADYVAYQPPGLSLTQWTAEMKKMQRAYGAPIDDGEVEQLGAYLAVAYGSAKSKTRRSWRSRRKAASPRRPHPRPPQRPPPRWTCRACWPERLPERRGSVTQKVVGPAYHEVATRYKDDAQAQAKLEASIRGGSSGKWGSVPMPPFAGLKADEVKALAAYVRQQ